MKTLNEFLSGKKTYIVAIGAVVAVAVSFLNGDLTVGEAVQATLGALGLATLRAGVTKAGQ